MTSFAQMIAQKLWLRRSWAHAVSRFPLLLYFACSVFVTNPLSGHVAYHSALSVQHVHRNIERSAQEPVYLDKPVIFGNTFSSGRRARFEKTGAGRDGDIRDKSITGFSGTVGYDGLVTFRMGKSYGAESLREGADLIRFDKDGIRKPLLYAIVQTAAVCDEKVVSHQHDFFAEKLRYFAPARNIIFSDGVFYRENRVPITLPQKFGDKLVRSQKQPSSR